MKIITVEQEVLERILRYWNNPNPDDFQNTMKNIQVFYPLTDHSRSLDWTFRMMRESSENLSNKYLNQELSMNCEKFILVVDSLTLSMTMRSYEEYLNDYTGKIKRMLLGI